MKLKFDARSPRGLGDRRRPLGGVATLQRQVLELKGSPRCSDVKGPMLSAPLITDNVGFTPMIGKHG